MSDLEIRPARPADLGTLVDTLGQNGFFVDRLARQQSGRGVLLTAWTNGLPAGDVYIRLEPAEEAEIRLYLPDVPFLTHLEVLAGHRNRGIGTNLITAAEMFLGRRGHDQVALAVEVANTAAARLYGRLGYDNWDKPPVICYSLYSDNRLAHAETCHVLVKQLAARDGGPPQPGAHIH